MKLILSYIKRHNAILIGAIITVVIFTVVFAAYGLPVPAVFYASLLSGIAIAVIGVFRLISYRKRHRELVQMKASVLITSDNLPEPLDFIEEDYQNLIRLLNQEHLSEGSKKDRLISDMNDYYTTWAHQIKTPIAAMSLMLQNPRAAKTKQSDADFADTGKQNRGLTRQKLQKDNAERLEQQTEDKQNNDSLELRFQDEQNAELTEQLFRIEQYVEMVLGYIRSENISNDLVIRYHKLDALIRQSVRKYSRQFIRRHLTLQYEPVEASILTDEKWFCFILEQLLMNALKYTQEGKISITYNEVNKKPEHLQLQTPESESARRICRESESGALPGIMAEKTKNLPESGYICARKSQNECHIPSK